MRKLRKIRQAQNLIGEPPRVLKKSQPTHSRPCSGRVSPPLLLPANGPKDHIINAFLEFKALTKATLEVNQTTCRNILQSFHLGSDEFLRVQLEEAEAAIYDNKTSTVIKGEMGHHMAAYSGSAGFVALDEEETERQGRVVFKTPPNDPIVVTARCTRVMLEDRILNMAEAISGTCGMGDPWESWTVPTINWVNGVPGCGKTTWVINQFDAENDLIVTTTTEAAKDLRSKLANRIGTDTKTKVRTMASVLVNGMRKQNRRCTRLLVDEALMNHFGAIVMAMRLSGAEKILLIGDINQLPYIDRENLFAMQYTRPSLVTTISQELLCTHRNPMDVAYALSEIYSGIYSSRSQVHSLERRSYTGLVIPGTLPNTLYLVRKQKRSPLPARDMVRVLSREF